MNPLPKIDLTVRISETRGSHLWACSVQAQHLSENFGWVGIRKIFPIGEYLHPRAKSREKVSVFAEMRPQTPTPCPGRATEEFP